MGTHVDPGSVLGKVMWRHLANANKTPARAERIRARSAINLRPEDGYLQLVLYKSIREPDTSATRHFGTTNP